METVTPNGDGTYVTSQCKCGDASRHLHLDGQLRRRRLEQRHTRSGRRGRAGHDDQGQPDDRDRRLGGRNSGQRERLRHGDAVGRLQRETGNVVFTLYDSSNAAVFSSTKSAAGNGAVTSGSFAPTSAGAYHWSATYVGDGNNNGPVSDNGSNESVTMSWANPLPAGTWTPLGHAAPNGIGTMELLTDGTVMALSGGNYYKLTPDATGSYVNGTWSQLASPRFNVFMTPRTCFRTDASLSWEANTRVLITPPLRPILEKSITR